MDGFGLFGMTGEEIYRNFAEATGAGDLAAASDLWKELQQEHEEEARRIRELAVRMESAWRGDAAGAAQRGAIPLAVEHESSAPLLFTDHDLFGRQVGSFNDARNRVVPVPPAPDRPSGFEILFSPQALPTYERKLAEYNNAAQHNVDVMVGYEGASSYNGENLPGSYGSLQPDSAGISVAPESDGDPGHPNDGGPPPGGGRRPSVEGNWLPHPGSSGPQPGSGPSTEPVGPSPGVSGGSRPQDTAAGGVVPTPSEMPSTRPGLPGGGPGVPGGGLPQVGELVPVGGWSSGGGMPGGPGSGGSPGFGGAGGRLGGEAGGGRAGGETGHGPGGRAGGAPVAGGTAAEPATRGAAGARGVGGAGLPVGVWVGRGRGAEDIERKAPDYLEEPDPEGLFGADVLTAPPVIGVAEDEPV